MGVNMDYDRYHYIKKIKLCFIAPNAYPLLIKNRSNNVIGPDLDQVTLAEELSNEDYDISFITYYDEHQLKKINDISIINIYDPNSKINFFFKLIYVWKSLKKADSDIYFHYGDFLGITSIYTFLYKKKSVFRIGSDYFVNKKIVNKKIKEFSRSKLSLRSIGSWLEIKLSTVICLQTKFQLRMLKSNYGKSGVIIKNHAKIIDSYKKQLSQKKFIALWVGSIADVKQPYLFVKLAKELPEIHFCMIGGYVGDINKKFIEFANNLDNFNYLGSVPPSDMNNYFKNASVLINTSLFEGFPNSFIQAWMNYTPVISLNANPDGLITKKNMGFHSKSFDQLKKDLEILFNNNQLRNEMGSNGRYYVEEEHDIDKIIIQYKKLFYHIIRTNKR
jgi:glycosyltransferase involved in cell wall biosynthesis